MKNRYLNAACQEEFMARRSGVLGSEVVCAGRGEKGTDIVLSGLSRLMTYKYVDVVLLASVAAAFGMLLAVSALS